MIETNLRMRLRRVERFGLQGILKEAHDQGRGHWINMPDAWPGPEDKDTTSLLLEGGDTLLNGFDVYVGDSGTGSSEGGIAWLQNLLGASYHVQAVKLRPRILHLDGVMALLRPGLGLLFRAGLAGELPESLSGFRWIEVNEEETYSLGVNGLVLDPETVIIQQRHGRLIDEIRKAGMEVIPLAYDGPATIGGALRCSSHPLIRES